MDKEFQYSDNFTKEQRLKSFKNNICETILGDNVLLSQEEFLYLRAVLAEYVKIKLNMEDLVIIYEPLPNLDKASSSFKENYISINSDYYSFHGDASTFKNDYGKIVELYSTIVHEISHFVDLRENIQSNSSRKFILDFHSYTPKLAKIFPQKEEFYNLLSQGLYFTDRSEVFARKSAEAQTKDFINELKNFAQKKISFDSEIEKKYSEYLKYLDEKEKGYAEPPEIVGKTLDWISMKYKLDAMIEKQEFIHKEDEFLLNIYQLSKLKNLPELKKDFQYVMEQFFNPNCLDKNIVSFDPYDLASLLKIPELYKKEYAEKLYDYAKKQGIKLLAAILIENKELNISDNERRVNAEYFQMLIEMGKGKKQNLTPEFEF